MLARTIEWDLLPQTQRFGTGVIAFAPLASGLLTDKYLAAEVPADSRAASIWPKEWVHKNAGEERRAILNGLNDIAKARAVARTNGHRLDAKIPSRNQCLNRRIARPAGGRKREGAGQPGVFHLRDREDQRAGSTSAMILRESGIKLPRRRR